jgi:hypothetical protein
MLLGSKARPVRGDDNLMSRLSRQCGILNMSQAYRPPRPVTGIGLLFTLLQACAGSTRSTSVRSFPPHGLVRNGRHEHEHGQHVRAVHVQRDGRHEAHAVPTRPAPEAARPFHSSSGESQYRRALPQLHALLHLALGWRVNDQLHASAA